MDVKEIWQAALGELEVELSKANFATWFKNTSIVSFKNSIITIGVPNAFTKEWLEKKYHQQIFNTLKKLLGDELKEINYKITETRGKPQFKIQSTHFQRKDLTNLNQKYTFENFVTGPSNRLAYAAALSVAKNPGITYNPLFIYGGVGLGKTHLLHAIGNKILQLFKDKKVLYTTCEKFTNEFIHAVRNGKAKEFKETYRSVDVLLIDDIQFLTGKEGTQEEFFHTFNALYDASKQIVISSDRSPKALPTLENRLISRFESGMIADISPPDYETRVAILQTKCKEKNYNLPEEVIDFIAKNIQNNIRELEGALTRLIAYCELNNLYPNQELAQEILGEALINGRKKFVSPTKLLEAVASFYNITLEDILSPKRNKELVYPRQIAAFLLREELKLSYPKIGEELGGRDHTTIMHACSKIEKEISENNELQQEINLLKEKIYCG